MCTGERPASTEIAADHSGSMSNIQFIKQQDDFLYQFSICTIVNNMQEYELMKKSFESCGFSDGCEWLVADNTGENRFDAYGALTRFIKEAKGKYLIVVHQDVRCVDKRDVLIHCLDELNSRDTHWALCGNAGCNGFHEKRMYMINDGEKITYTNLPARVESLDENFIVINASANIAVSADLHGFHLYGTDICLAADFLGYNAYVIPFMVNHLSKGNLAALETFIPEFLNAYTHKLRNRYMETTCTRFYIAGSKTGSVITNNFPFAGLVKIFERIKQQLRKSNGQNNHKKQVEKISNTINL